MNNLTSVNFRRLNRADAEIMASLERVCFTLPWSSDQCRNAFDQKAFAAFGILHGNVLLAYVSIYHARPEIEILNVAVRPEERGKGLGRNILDLVLQAAIKMGMQKATLEVRESNYAAIALYRSMGFCPCGRRSRYYPDNDEDALVYALHLNN